MTYLFCFRKLKKRRQQLLGVKYNKKRCYRNLLFISESILIVTVEIDLVRLLSLERSRPSKVLLFF